MVIYVCLFVAVVDCRQRHCLAGSLSGARRRQRLFRPMSAYDRVHLSLCICWTPRQTWFKFNVALRHRDHKDYQGQGPRTATSTFTQLLISERQGRIRLVICLAMCNHPIPTSTPSAPPTPTLPPHPPPSSNSPPPTPVNRSLSISKEGRGQ